METLSQPKYQVIYQGKDITVDLANTVTEIVYNDRVAGESDEIEIVVEDSAGLWRHPWQPAKRDVLEVWLGYDLNMFRCGVFEVDELAFSGPPDTVSIRGLAIPISSGLRTKKSYAHEKKRLSEIAKKVAEAHGMTVDGVIDRDIVIERSTQNNESDLAYLKRLAMDFGYIFSIRGKQLFFSSIYDLENEANAFVLNRTDLITYNLKDSAQSVYKSAKLDYHDPVNAELVSAEALDGTGFETSENVLTLRGKSESVQQAEIRAKAALHNANTKAVSGNIKVVGMPQLLAGVNFELTGMGRLSGTYHVLSSVHTQRPGDGYSTEAEIKKTGQIDPSKW